MGAFEEWANKLRLPLNRDAGRNILGAFARVIADLAAEEAEDANFEHLPQKASITDSIKLVASERLIEPGTTETTANLARRLTYAVDQWQLASQPVGMLCALQFAGFCPVAEDVIIVQQNGRAHRLTTVPPDLDDMRAAVLSSDLGNNPPIGGVRPLAAGVTPWWHIDTDIDAENDQFNGRFALLYPAPLGTWAAPVNPPTDVSSPTRSEVNRLRRIVQRWKPAKAKCVGIYVATAGEMWGWPVGTWGDPGVWGGTVVHWPIEEN